MLRAKFMVEAALASVDATAGEIKEAWIAAARNVAVAAVKIAVLGSLKVGG